MELWRTANTVLALVGTLLTFWWIFAHRKSLLPSELLVLMGLGSLLFVAAYGSFEAAYLNTLFRVPMVTVAVMWVILAAFLPARFRRD